MSKGQSKKVILPAFILLNSIISGYLGVCHAISHESSEFN